MHVKVALTQTDITSGSRRVCAQVRRRFFLIYAIALVICYQVDKNLLVFLQKQNFYKNIPGQAHPYIFGILFFLTLVAVFKFLAHYSAQELYRPDGLLRASREITLHEKGITQTSQNYTSLTSWSGIMKIEEDKEFIFLYIDTISAYAIPKRFFNTAQEASAFIQQARSFHDAAKSAAAVP
jgi:hypothetical protein